MAHYCEAHYDIRDNSFLPPTRSIGFNPQLKINDSLLAQSYVEAYDISYPEAVRRIEKETDRDNYLNPYKAIELGLIDVVIDKSERKIKK